MIKRDLLFFCPKCKNLSDDLVSNLKCDIPGKHKTYKKGELISAQGDKITHLVMLTKGKVKTELISDSGMALPMEEISAPFPLAAAFLFADDNHSPVDITALEDSEVIFISKEAVMKQMMACPCFLKGFMAFNANRIKYLSDRLKLFAQKGIKAKIAYYILSKAKDNKFDTGRSITSLAEYFGVERPSLSRALSEMTRDGVISYHAGKGTVLDYNELHKLLD